jgi:hypothetical protein
MSSRPWVLRVQCSQGLWSVGWVCRAQNWGSSGSRIQLCSQEGRWCSTHITKPGDAWPVVVRVKVWLSIHLALSLRKACTEHTLCKLSSAFCSLCDMPVPFPKLTSCLLKWLRVKGSERNHGVFQLRFQWAEDTFLWLWSRSGTLGSVDLEWEAKGIMDRSGFWSTEEEKAEVGFTCHQVHFPIQWPYQPGGAEISGPSFPRASNNKAWVEDLSTLTPL